jgi:hypothetical protein
VHASRRRFLGSLAALASLACRPRGSSSHADLLVFGRVQQRAGQPPAEALAVRAGVITAIGSARELASLRGPSTRVLELGEGAVLPGLHDAHAHLIGLGRAAEIVDLRGASSIDEVVARLRAAAPREGWLLGRGWDQNRWGGAMPTRAPLDAAFGERPVWLQRIDGHAGWASSATLARAGIDASTQAPEGGEILRDEHGAPSGVLVDAAMDLVPEPPASAADVARWAATATREAARHGLVAVHEMGMDALAATAFHALSGPSIRVFGYASEAWWQAGLSGWTPPDAELAHADPTRRFELVGVKIYVDGALGSRGAALLEPYADRPDSSGLLLHEPEYFHTLVAELAAARMQPAAHAIGDRAIRTILDAYAAVPSVAALRPRIEHVQVIDLADIPRMAELGVIASMQPTHATSDMPWAPQRLGPTRLAGAYAWRRMLDAAVPLALGSDFPVEQVSPLLGLHAAVTRQDLAGLPAGGWLPEQRLRLDEAIAGFSAGAAYALRREQTLGHVAVGMAADLTLLERDPFTVEPAELAQLRVFATIVGGALVFEA